jgi:hypothetical protein
MEKTVEYTAIMISPDILPGQGNLDNHRLDHKPMVNHAGDPNWVEDDGEFIYVGPVKNSGETPILNQVPVRNAAGEITSFIIEIIPASKINISLPADISKN